MSTRFQNNSAGPVPCDDEETVDALVKMLTGMGIDRTRIDAMITKASRPAEAPRRVPKAGNANVTPSRFGSRRTA